MDLAITLIVSIRIPMVLQGRGANTIVTRRPRQGEVCPVMTPQRNVGIVPVLEATGTYHFAHSRFTTNSENNIWTQETGQLHHEERDANSLIN